MGAVGIVVTCKLAERKKHKKAELVESGLGKRILRFSDDVGCISKENSRNSSYHRFR